MGSPRDELAGPDRRQDRSVSLRPLEEYRLLRARTLAGLFVAGGTLSAVVVLLPGWPGMHANSIFLLAGLAVAAGLALWCWGQRFSTTGISAYLALGTMIIAVAQSLAGGGAASAAYAMLYVWVALHAAMYLRRGVVGLHLAGTVVAHVLALVHLGELASIASMVALTLGTQIAAGVVVGRMAGHLRRVADTDHLTGLPNRRTASRELDRRMVEARRPGRGFSVAVLDLDGFKALNDRCGHAAGDAVLVDAARAWRAVLEPGWVLARTGGDEFLLIVPGRDRTTVERAVGLLRGVAPGVSFSAGTAHSDGWEAVGALLERADRALYSAKARGGRATDAVPPAVAP